MTTSDTRGRARRKFAIERGIGRYVANPLMRGLRRIGIDTTMATELETIGRKTGKIRQVPVAAAFDESGAWVISQHGTRAGWTANITANPQVGIRQGRQWRTGTAQLVPDDDVAARARTFVSHAVFAGVAAATFRALRSAPVSVRITFTDTGPRMTSDTPATRPL